jgi:hypothetical protein
MKRKARLTCPACRTNFNTRPKLGNRNAVVLGNDIPATAAEAERMILNFIMLFTLVVCTVGAPIDRKRQRNSRHNETLGSTFP